MFNGILHQLTYITAPRFVLSCSLIRGAYNRMTYRKFPSVAESLTHCKSQSEYWWSAVHRSDLGHRLARRNIAPDKDGRISGTSPWYIAQYVRRRVWLYVTPGCQPRGPVLKKPGPSQECTRHGPVRCL